MRLTLNRLSNPVAASIAATGTLVAVALIAWAVTAVLQIGGAL